MTLFEYNKSQFEQDESVLGRTTKYEHKVSQHDLKENLRKLPKMN